MAVKVKKKAERREHPRIEQKLPLKVVANGYDFSTTTMNVSCVGAYCNVAKYMPPFTRVMVRLNLPVVTENTSRSYDFECKGVIVRAEDAEKGGFNIAIFFNEINDIQRHKISRYVNQFLSQTP